MKNKLSVTIDCRP